ncbi:hypothetical protein VNI00_006345 [Paramarasmius palmivorus]|uniref:Uncharacterized protein n=1 Tax=Paramarasmius palmivorus TaxID=297713 RepID=A0AAW0D9H5_9AGAR
MTATKTPNKRRKISASRSSSSSTSSTVESSKINPTISLPVTATSRLICVSCHRALNASSNSKTSCLILCARCGSPTCTICSRTCAGPIPPNSVSSLSEFCQDSAPETPHLTWSTSSPTSTPSPPSMPSSPRRFALAINAANTNTNANAPIGPHVTTNKRKIFDQGDEEDESRARGSGCGRVVCRNCCSENAQSDVCHDCKVIG